MRLRPRFRPRFRPIYAVLEPGERGPFHIHDTTYFWTVVDPGRGRQRFADGTFVVRDYEPGETKYLVHSPERTLRSTPRRAGTSAPAWR